MRRAQSRRKDLSMKRPLLAIVLLLASCCGGAEAAPYGPNPLGYAGQILVCDQQDNCKFECPSGQRLSGKDPDEKRCVPDKPKAAKKVKGGTGNCAYACPVPCPEIDYDRIAASCKQEPPDAAPFGHPEFGEPSYDKIEEVEPDNDETWERGYNAGLRRGEKGKSEDGHWFTFARLGYLPGWRADVTTRETAVHKLDHSADLSQSRSPQVGLIAGWISPHGWTIGAELDRTFWRGVRVRSWDSDQKEIARTSVDADRAGAWSVGAVLGKVWGGR